MAGGQGCLAFPFVGGCWKSWGLMERRAPGSDYSASALPALCLLVPDSERGEDRVNFDSGCRALERRGFEEQKKGV